MRTQTSPSEFTVPSTRLEYVMFDVGGVMVVPNPKSIGDVVKAFGAENDTARIIRAHYGAMNAGDSDTGFDWDVYQRTLIRMCGVAPSLTEECLAKMLEMVSVTPALWNYSLEGVRDSLEELSKSLGVAVISNSDGTAASLIAGLGFCQVGPGAGVEIPFVLDSAIVGVEKPHPRIFLSAADLVSLPPEAIAYVGDTRAFDVVGAQGVGMRAIHIDPYDDCEAPEGHEHARSIRELPTLLGVTG